MPLNDDQKLQIKFALGTSSSEKKVAQLVSAVEISIAEYQGANAASFTRAAAKALERLWKLAENYDPEKLERERDPNVDGIRRAIKALPEGALRFIEQRPSASVFLLGEPDFRQWAQSADDSDLVAATRALSAYGACLGPGRSRGLGKRSGPQLKPVIEQTHRGGRPSNESKFILIALLALDWLHVTGHKPKPGRATNTGFGYLVCSVFEWLKMTDEADHSDEDSLHVLRQYWEVVKESRNRPTGDAPQPD
jgi:hypothetical protein